MRRRYHASFGEILSPYNQPMLRVLTLAMLLVGCGSKDQPPRPRERPVAADAAPIDPARPDKRTVITEMLSRGQTDVKLDARRPGVLVPPDRAFDAKLLLGFEPGAEIDATSIAANFTFDGKPFRVVVPWSAVYSARDANGETVWESDKPTDFDGDRIAKPNVLSTTADKRTTIQTMLAIREVLIYLDARHAGVVVPEQHRHELDLTLRIGYVLEPPIPDLALDARGLSGTLQFVGKPFKIRVPWKAIYGAVIEGYGQGVMWEADIPKDATAR